jgi:hypothetical protein
MEIDQKIKFNYFGKQTIGVVKNIYFDNQVPRLALIQINSEAKIWLSIEFLTNG